MSAFKLTRLVLHLLHNSEPLSDFYFERVGKHFCANTFVCNPDLDLKDKQVIYLFHFFEVIVKLGSFCPSNLLADFLEEKEGIEKEMVNTFISKAL